jgi:hypothetical protein
LKNIKQTRSVRTGCKNIPYSLETPLAKKEFYDFLYKTIYEEWEKIIKM